MSQQDNAWTGRWVSKKIGSHEDVASVTLLSSQRLELVRKKYSPVIIATTSVKCLDAVVLRDLIDGNHSPRFVVNIPKESYIAGDALKLAAMHGVGLGGLGDLMRALREPDLGTYMNPEFSFVERGMGQHSRIKSYERLANRCYRLTRHGLNDVRVVLLNEYELTADHLRTARDRYGFFNIALITNPNGGATSAATDVANSMNVQIHRWGEFLGALNRR